MTGRDARTATLLLLGELDRADVLARFALLCGIAHIEAVVVDLRGALPAGRGEIVEALRRCAEQRCTRLVVRE